MPLSQLAEIASVASRTDGAPFYTSNLRLVLTDLGFDTAANLRGVVTPLIQEFRVRQAEQGVGLPWYEAVFYHVRETILIAAGASAKLAELKAAPSYPWLAEHEVRRLRVAVAGVMVPHLLQGASPGDCYALAAYACACAVKDAFVKAESSAA